MELLQFVKLRSQIDISFWVQLIQFKLHTQGLSTEHIPLSLEISQEGVVYLTNQSFEVGDAQVKGKLINFNTLSDFKDCDRAQQLLQAAQEQFTLLIISYADIKKHRFHYQVAFPALLYKDYLPLVISQDVAISQLVVEGKKYSQEDVQVIARKFADQSLIVATVNFATDILPLDYSANLNLVLIKDYSQVESQAGWILRSVLTRYQKAITEPSQEMLILSVKSTTKYFLMKVKLIKIPRDAAVVAVGWEHLKLQTADISKLVDPLTLCKQATSLNLQLMKWRLAPELDLDVVAQSRVLVLGVGTLGCNVIRVLMGWNVQHIDIVDNGTVSYSNLSRQPLFKFSDYGKSKVDAVVENVRDISPGFDITSYHLTIPSPGHHNDCDEDALNRLLELIAKAHVVFLLTDSRETRYLPTMICYQLKKLCINAALGFDSYLLMRQYPQLGCYFCSDVVGPRDSMLMRTLDEQCTVTRPGLAAQCAAQAVEMYVQLLQHPLGFQAPDEAPQLHSDINSEFGVVPHVIRYYQRYMQLQLLSVKSFQQCCACSMSVQQKFSIDFMLSLIKNPSLIDDVSGLEQLCKDVEDVDVEWSD